MFDYISLAITCVNILRELSCLFSTVNNISLSDGGRHKVNCSLKKQNSKMVPGNFGVNTL